MVIMTASMIATRPTVILVLTVPPYSVALQEQFLPIIKWVNLIIH